MVRRKTHEEFVKEVYDLVGDEYSVLGHYTRSSEKLEIQHNICGHKWFITPNNFLKGKDVQNVQSIKLLKYSVRRLRKYLMIDGKY